ncbi:hypothetical protein C8F04DRAFT_1093665 [Mycena alexandri]|uniref:Protein kinase domain-containing protein n=1 Tax=Mycena alexandri TaxID=1745969 RepID=A0AAD6X9B0_9AGAR|nr:hypothetical protein C8F04DRAFT_1157744 [Mycena alexandri]KAJ7036864.1 hypothetical protein C8F04DRAFT_1093665 [Mycena alexandri]
MNEELPQTRVDAIRTTEGAPPAFAGIFSGSQHFTVTGGIFNSHNHIATTEFSDFAEIPLGSIDLRHQIRPGGYHGVVGRRERGCVRRVYIANIKGRNPDMTVAVYQGKGAEEEWRKDISRYSCLRHPSFVQLCGITTSSLMHATIFHDDLIPLENFLENSYTLALSIYVHAYCSMEFWEANDYFSSVFRQRLCITECTFWIRRSTGKLCTDLISTNISHRIQTPQPDSYEITFSQPPNEQAITVDSLSVQKYHEICYWDLSQVRHIHNSTPVTVNLGAIISWSSSDHLEAPLMLASVSHVEFPMLRWHITRGGRGEVTESGWTRWRAGNIMNRTLRIHIWHWNPECWLSQANHIFDRLKLEGNFQDHVVVDDITFEIPIQALPQDYLLLPAGNNIGTGLTLCKGYLFLCPVDDFRAGPCSFRWPDRPAYWSLDSSGSQPLSIEEAKELGFPPLQFNTTIRGKCWDHKTYTELRRFHLAKGFDPISQDVARYLGDPFYQLTQESTHDDCARVAGHAGPDVGEYDTAHQGISFLVGFRAHFPIISSS